MQSNRSAVSSGMRPKGRVLSAFLIFLLLLAARSRVYAYSTGEAASLVIGQSSFTTSTTATTATEFNSPRGIAIDPSGNLWVTDRSNNRVLGFSYPFSTGEAASVVIGQSNFTTSAAATTASGLNNPRGIAFDSEGNLWLTEQGNNRVLEYGVQPPPPPSIFQNGIVPLDSAVGTIQPGEWVSIYGTNLASSTAIWDGGFPTFLGGTTVTIDGKLSYLSYVNSTQINLQAPDDTATGPVPVVVTTTTGSFTSTVTLAQFAPSFYLLDSKHVAGIIPRSNGSGAYGGGSYDILGPTGNSLGYPTVAAKAGDVVELLAVGLGPTNPTVPAGGSFLWRGAGHQFGESPHQQGQRDPELCRIVRRGSLPDQPDGPGWSRHRGR